MRIISFNIRGIGGPENGRYPRDIIMKEEIDMTCIQETKQTNITDEKCYVVWCDNNIEQTHHGSENGAEGILCIWNKYSFSLSKSRSSKGFIILEGKWGVKRQPTIIVNVYSPCAFNEKRIMWEYIIKIRR